jgi:periplasmic protein TonB
MNAAIMPRETMMDRSLGLIAITALHLAAGYALFVAIKPATPPALIDSVRIELLPSVEEAPAQEPSKPQPLPVAPREVERPQPVRQPPRPQPVARPEPTLAAPATAPSVSEAPPAPKQAAAQTETPPPVAAEPAKPTTGKADAPAVQPARFDADYLHNPQLPYPRASRTLHEQGKVLLRVLVSEDGRALQVLLNKSSGFPRLDQAALDGVQQWRFTPARQGSQAIADWVLVPITFELNS